MRKAFTIIRSSAGYAVLLFHMFLATAVMAVVSSCTTTKYVPEGEFLLNQVKLKVVDDTVGVNTGNLRNYVRQKPNARWFTLYKLPLATYSMSGRDTTRWLNRTLRSLGEPPVLFDSTKALLTCGDLEQQLRNEGFLGASVTVDTRQRGRKKKDVTYLLTPGAPYTVGSLRYTIADPIISDMLEGDSTRRMLKEGMRFNVSQLDAERKRITTLLTDSGYYRFHKEFITYFYFAFD